MSADAVQPWIDYLQKQLDSWSSQVTAVTAAAGLVPATIVSTALQSSTELQYLWFEILGVGIFVIIMGFILARVAIRRVIVRHILELILSGVLQDPQQIAHYYSRWMSWE